MLKILQSEWTASLLGSILYCVILAMTLHLPDAETAVAAGGPRAPKETYSFDYRNPEMDQLMEELKNRKSQLDQKESQLNELSVRLKNEREEIDVITQTVYRVQQQFDKNILRLRDAETTNLKKLSKTYIAMSPDGAAAILKSLDEDTIAKVLRLMKDIEAGPILESLARISPAEAQRAARIVERMRVAVNDPATNAAPKGP